MAGSSFGEVFRVHTFGESHGGAVGVIVDGVTPGLPLTEAEVQVQLDRRKPGQSFITTPRAEPDIVHFMSGIFEGQTTGTPLLMILYNKDFDPGAYSEIKDKFRPGHADFTYLQKYGLRDYRGSGRASGRETAGRVAAGAIAQKLLARRGVKIIAYSKRVAGIECQSYDPTVIEQNPLRACDPVAAAQMVEKLTVLKDAKDSAGGIIECRVSGLAAGLGEPVFDKLDGLLAHAMLSIGATKGIEFGRGFAAADMTGSQHNDHMDKTGFKTNNAGGIIGGLSTGAELIFRVAVKPVSSIASKQQTINLAGDEVDIITEGRHDVCICPRIVPVIEAMTALVLEDLYKRQAAMLA